MILLKNISLGKEEYFYIFGPGDCDYPMSDDSNISNQDTLLVLTDFCPV